MGYDGLILRAKNDAGQHGATRRALLKTVTAAASLPVIGHAEAPAPPVFRFFHDGQVRTLDALTEAILPADEHSPGARAARVAEYIDLIVNDAPAPRKQLWVEGLAAVEQRAQSEWQKPFADGTPEQQEALLRAFAGGENPEGPPNERFFAVLKRATVDGYYTSAIGIHQDLRYQGNKALRQFPSCDHDGQH